MILCGLLGGHSRYFEWLLREFDAGVWWLALCEFYMMRRISAYYIRDKGFSFNIIFVSHFWLYMELVRGLLYDRCVVYIDPSKECGTYDQGLGLESVGLVSWVGFVGSLGLWFRYMVTGHFVNWTVCLVGHFTYWTLCLLVISPTGQFACSLDILPTYFLLLFFYLCLKNIVARIVSSLY